ncbi:MAG: glycosyltransferase family 39 protein [Anaerolineae bacterium]|nr:glycosyltransferase family 39 protein [Anaerolineae bacterium]
MKARVMRMRRHAGIAVLCVLFVLLTQVYQPYLLAYEGPDEPSHVAYVLWVRNTSSLPDPVAQFESPIRQQVTQNPLYYVLAAVFSTLTPFDYSTVQVAEAHNPWRTHQGALELYENRNQFLMNPAQHALTPDQVRQTEAVRWLRLLSPVFGVAAVIGLYAAALVLWPARYGWAVLAAMGLAFNPVFIQTSAVVTNDLAVAAFGMWALWAMLSLRRHPSSLVSAVLAGGLVGLAALSKTTGAMLVPAAILALGVGWFAAPRRSWGVLVRQMGVLGVAMVVFGGWWYGWLWLTYGDPTGSFTHSQMPWATQGMMHPEAMLNIAQRALVSMWADMGWGGSIIPPAWWWLSFWVPLVGGLLGLRRVRWSADVLILLAALLGVVLGMVMWARVSSFVPGRLIFAAVGAPILLWVWCAMQLPRLRWAWAAMLGLGAVLVVPLTLAPAFGTPRLYPPDALPTGLQGQPLDMGIARFLGYRMAPDALRPDEAAFITLCWQAPPPVEGQTHQPVPYAFTVQFLRQNDFIASQRDSYPGLGNYTLWQSGMAFCDEVQLRPSNTIEGGQPYRMMVRLYDPVTQQSVPAYAPDGTRTDFVDVVVAAPPNP